MREKMVKSLKGDEAEGGEDGDAGLEGKENALMSFPSYFGMSATLHFEKTILELMAQSIWYPSAVGAVTGAGTDAAEGADAVAGGEKATTAAVVETAIVAGANDHCCCCC